MRLSARSLITTQCGRGPGRRLQPIFLHDGSSVSQRLSIQSTDHAFDGSQRSKRLSASSRDHQYNLRRTSLSAASLSSPSISAAVHGGGLAVLAGVPASPQRSLWGTRTATQIELDHATDCWLDGPEPPRKAPRVHKDGSTQTAWTCPTFRPGDLVKKSMPKTRPDTWDVFRVLSVEEDGRVIVEVEDVYLGSTLEADPHHFRHLTDDEIRTRTLTRIRPTGGPLSTHAYCRRGWRDIPRLTRCRAPGRRRNSPYLCVPHRKVHPLLTFRGNDVREYRWRWRCVGVLDRSTRKC